MTIDLLSPLQFATGIWPDEAELSSGSFFSPPATPEVFFPSLDSPQPCLVQEEEPAQANEEIGEELTLLEDSTSLQQPPSKNCAEPCQKRGLKTREEKMAHAREVRRARKDKTAANERARYKTHKAEIAAHKRLYRQTHKDELAARRRVYIQIHKETISARGRAYFQSHKVEIAARKQLYNQTHRTEIAANKRLYRQTNKDEIAARKRLYRQTHKAEIAAHRRLCRQARTAEESGTQATTAPGPHSRRRKNFLLGESRC